MHKYSILNYIYTQIRVCIFTHTELYTHVYTHSHVHILYSSLLTRTNICAHSYNSHRQDTERKCRRPWGVNRGEKGGFTKGKEVFLSPVAMAAQR